MPAQALVTAPIPPQNLDAEESVLGAMMLSPLAIGAVTESTNLSAADFYRESHGQIYKAILALYATAHHLHFQKHDMASAIAAWDRYLAAAPAGKLAPEARYNRLVALVRLERWDDAARALDVISDATFRPADIAKLRALISSRQPR